MKNTWINFATQQSILDDLEIFIIRQLKQLFAVITSFEVFLCILISHELNSLVTIGQFKLRFTPDIHLG